MSGSNALTIAADPTVQVNPLSAINAGTTAAGNVLKVQAAQGERLVGQALQQATDENGNLDFAKAQKIAAGMGPSAAFAMQGFLKTSSQLRGEQLSNVAGSMKLRGIAAMSALQDASDGNINTIFDNLISNGMSAAEVNQERARILAMNPAQRQQEAYRYGLQSLEQMHQVIGQTTSENVGGQIVAKTVGQPSPWGPGGISRGPGALDVTPTPGEALQGGYHYPATQEDVDAGRAKSVGQDIYIPGAEVYKRAGLPVPPGLVSGGGGGGVVGADGKPVSPANPPRLLNVPNQPTSPPAPYQGTGTGTAADTVPIYQPPAGTPPAAPAASQPPGSRSSLEGGVPVASANPLLAPTVGAPGPPSPLVPGDVNAIMAGMNQRRVAGPTPGTQTAFNTIATGPGTEEAAGYKASADKLAADDAFAAEWQKTQFPYVQALKNYGEGTKTGPTTDFWNQVAGTIRTPLAKLGINIGPLADTTERVDSLGKWLSNILPNARSDAELANVLKGSASTHINEVAGEDMVKAGFALGRMKIALNNDWHNNPALQAQYGTYQRYLGDMNNKIDPRAFMVDILNDKGDNSQKTRLIAQLKNGSEADAARFEASLALARRTGQIGGAGSQAMP